MKNDRKDNMKKYKVNIEELGYEEIIEAEDEDEAELDALVHCKMYLQDYVKAQIEEIEEIED